MADVTPAPGTTGPIAGTISVQQSWDNLMQRIGYYGVDLVKAGSLHLDKVDAITKTSSRKLPV